MWPFKKRCKHMYKWETEDGSMIYTQRGNLPRCTERGVAVRRVPCPCGREY